MKITNILNVIITILLATISSSCKRDNYTSKLNFVDAHDINAWMIDSIDIVKKPNKNTSPIIEYEIDNIYKLTYLESPQLLDILKSSFLVDSVILSVPNFSTAIKNDLNFIIRVYTKKGIYRIATDGYIFSMYNNNNFSLENNLYCASHGIQKLNSFFNGLYYINDQSDTGFNYYFNNTMEYNHVKYLSSDTISILINLLKNRSEVADLNDKIKSFRLTQKFSFTVIKVPDKNSSNYKILGGIRTLEGYEPKFLYIISNDLNRIDFYSLYDRVNIINKNMF